jgi:hypothetical protein
LVKNRRFSSRGNGRKIRIVADAIVTLNRTRPTDNAAESLSTPIVTTMALALGVDRSVQERGLGGRLLLRAAERCMTAAQEVGGVALLIDAKSDRAAQWYESYGAARLLDAPLSLVLPFAMAIKALKQGN